MQKILTALLVQLCQIHCFAGKLEYWKTDGNVSNENPSCIHNHKNQLQNTRNYTRIFQFSIAAKQIAVLDP